MFEGKARTTGLKLQGSSLSEELSFYCLILPSSRSHCWIPPYPTISIQYLTSISWGRWLYNRFRGPWTKQIIWILSIRIQTWVWDKLHKKVCPYLISLWLFHNFWIICLNLHWLKGLGNKVPLIPAFTNIYKRNRLGDLLGVIGSQLQFRCSWVTTSNSSNQHNQTWRMAQIRHRILPI